MSIFVDIEKKIGKFHLRVRLEAENEVLALLGASGCGKSMTLKCIAGVEKPDRGKIVVDGMPLFDSEQRICLSPQERRCGLMFQNYALFPNMTVRKNIYAGTLRDIPKARRMEAVDEIMERFGLRGLENQLPAQLSGGQQQRVALARILVSKPRILMLDEPFSALDSHLRFQMEGEVRQIIQNFGKTVLLVSHDRDEVFRLADQVAVMHAGQVEVSGSRKEVFSHPKTRNACILTGCKNISPIRKVDEHHLIALDWGLELETEEVIGTASYIGIRHHYTNGDFAGNAFSCEVVQVIENPFTYTVMLRRAGHSDAAAFGWELEKGLWQQIQSDRLDIHIPPQAILLLKE